jgi:hypothetical protein
MFGRAATGVLALVTTAVLSGSPAWAAPQPPLTVAPRRVRTGRMTTFRFRVRAGRLAVRRAPVRVAGHSVRTDAAGRERIRARLTRRGLRPAVAWKRTFRRGATRVRVL